MGGAHQNVVRTKHRDTGHDEGDPGHNRQKATDDADDNQRHSPGLPQSFTHAPIAAGETVVRKALLIRHYSFSHYWFRDGMFLTGGGSGTVARYARTSARSPSDITLAV